MDNNLPECTILKNNIVRLVYPKMGNLITHWKVVLSPDDADKIKNGMHWSNGNLIWCSGERESIVKDYRKWQNYEAWNFRKGGDEPTYQDTDFNLPKAAVEAL